MAVFIPTIPKDFNSSFGELKAYEALRHLNDQYTIFHSYNWVSIEENRTLGEADFVVIHPQKGILVIEVKSGGIEFDNGQWRQINSVTGFTKTIHPFTQAIKTRFEVLDRLNKISTLKKAPLVCHAVWFTSAKINQKMKLPAECSHEIIFDEDDLNGCNEKLNLAYEYWEKRHGFQTRLTSLENKKVIETLMPYFRIVPSLQSTITEAEAAFIMLTKQQTLILDYLQEQDIAVIHGLAGTGKTLLAKEKAKMLADQGKQVLFLCYNTFLKAHLRETYPQPGIVYHNIHSLAYEMIADPSIDQNDIIDVFQEFLLDFENSDWPYDHVIIDEGQDISDEIIEKIYLLTKAKKGSFYVFYDRNQYIMKNIMPKWVNDAECKLILHKNCRNTAEIFKTSCGLLNIDSNRLLTQIHGEKPMIHFIQNYKQLTQHLASFIRKAIKGSIKPEEIALLTVETEDTSMLGQVEKIAGYEVTNTKEIGKILFTTVRKFKGLEAKAVFVVDVSLKKLLDQEKRRLLYVGASRAKHLLEVSLIEDIDARSYGEYLSELDNSRNVPRNRKGLARLLNAKIC
ncbi:nuclease-related domain-containing DEAD/DEAH box helicase [Isachenkonia alkalipeptolytica]|uniref:DUF2075 domain-containing protein n=1 Tax=Isachenkonia alkalipeptolytica TaxID=2565777 RepID=A0AA43XJZ7_9CLOT|nr:ATP-binding domain-containing protein [Isachenkonia alkalipeptolytica]NBG87679.1 DUF2075 domain-containing protein [Isachenkonia alkalipeptolytica]